MADTTKEKILKINTQGAEKNVKSLKTQIRELKEQLAGLEQGTAEYDRVSKQLADTNQKQIEINEAMKYSNKNLGATLSNLTSVASGVVGAISSVNGVMSLMGADSEEAQKAMVRIQSLMSIIQGMGAIDTAIKALKGLTVAFKDFNVVRGANAGVVAGAATAELAEAGALADNTVKMHKNNEEAKEFNRLNEEGKEATDKSKEAIDRETKALIANKEAKSGNIEAAKQLVDLQIKQKEVVKNATDFANEAVQGQIDGLKKKLDAFEKEYKQGLDLGHTEANDNRMSYLSGRINRLKSEIKYFETEVLNSADVITAGWGMAVEEGFSMYDDAIEESIKQMLSAMSPTQLEAASKNLENFVKAKSREIQDLGHLSSEEIEAELDRLVAYADEQDALINQAIANREVQAMQENVLQKEIIETTAAENAETTATEANTLAKRKNAGATGEVVASETALGNATKKNDPILRKAWAGLTKGIGNAFKAIKGFVLANPILAGIAAAVAAIGAGIAIWAKAYADSHKEAAELQKMNNEINMELKRQQTDMQALLRMFNAQNTSQKEKEVLAKEINKLAKEELVTRNEITGEWTISNDKLKEYNKNLRTSIELEYHKKAILESMDAEEEARNNAIHERNHLIGSLFRTESGYLEDANEEVAKQEEHWKAIEKLTAGTVKNIERENKLANTVKTTVGGIKKTFQELYKELSELYKRLYNNIANAAELRKVYNGIYTEASVAFDKIFNSINANRYALKISDEFKTALKNGLKDIKATDISLDMIFGDAFNELEAQLNSAKGRLKSMLTATKIDEKELAKQKTYVDELEKELKTMTDIANAVLKYKQTVESTREAQEERNKANEHYNKELETTMRYMEQQRRENGRSHVYADIEREIELNTQLRNETNQRLREEKARLDELQASNLKNKETMEEIADLQKRIDEDEKTANEAKLNISNARWQKRLTQLDEEYEAIKRNSEAEQQALEIDRTQKGGGVADYNTDSDLIEMQLEAMAEYANHIDEFYAERQAQYAEDSEQWLLLENERLAAQEQLQAEYREKELEADRVHADRRLNIQKTYIAAYQALSSQIGSILSAEMERYDENSKEYKNMKYAQGVINTGEGVLAAFMSGIDSGIPAPWNLALAAAMSGIALTAGIMQLNNIKNEKLGGSMPNSVNIGSEYDTLSYVQGAETLSAIQDQRVYVLESDISSTQQRVQVQETQATF